MKSGERMGVYEIDCIIHDQQQRIIQVRLRGFPDLYTVESICGFITRHEHNFFTIRGGARADVYARQHPHTRRWFLTTEPDGIQENNLDFLPSCH